MRNFSLLLSAALLALPVLAHAADAPKAPAPPAPAAAPASAAAATPAVTPVAAVTPPGAPASQFSDNQRAEIEGIIKDYLTKKDPEVLMQAMQELQKRQAADSDSKAKAAISSNQDKIYNDADTPVGGNPKGDVTVVEFFDYQCGYCKMTEPAIQKLITEDKNVKVIYKDFPILGAVSTISAKAAIASIKQGKYLKFHDALMANKQHLTEDDVYKIAKDSGLDVDKLKKDMNDDSVTKVVEANVALGTDIGARGTPTFIVNNQIYPGALEYAQLKKIVDDARPAKK